MLNIVDALALGGFFIGMVIMLIVIAWLAIMILTFK